MSEYRIYIIGNDGHYVNAENIECADDQEAIQKAQQAADGCGVELWERGRFITQLRRKTGEANLAMSEQARFILLGIITALICCILIYAAFFDIGQFPPLVTAFESGHF
jgi:hypothetical protein